MNRLIKFVIATTLVGIVTGLLASCAMKVSYATGGVGDVVTQADWQSMGRPPQKPTRIIMVDKTNIVVVSADKYYVCCKGQTGFYITQGDCFSGNGCTAYFCCDSAPGLTTTNDAYHRRNVGATFCCDGDAHEWGEIPLSDLHDSNVTPSTRPRPAGVRILNFPADAVDRSVQKYCVGTCFAERHFVIRADGTVWTWLYAPSGLNGESSSGAETSLSSHAWLIWLAGAALGGIVGIIGAIFIKLAQGGRR